MPQSKTKLFHVYPDVPGEPPFECSTGDMTGQGLEVVIDKRTHELEVLRDGETEEAVTVVVRPRGVQAQGPLPRPGTRMLDLDASSSDPTKQAGDSIERLRSGAIGAPRG